MKTLTGGSPFLHGTVCAQRAPLLDLEFLSKHDLPYIVVAARFPILPEAST